MAWKSGNWLRTLGAPEDPVATDVSSSWSAMSLLKAIYQNIGFNGPTSSVSGNLVAFDGTTGKVGADSGVAPSTDGTFAADSDAKLPTEKAVKTYADGLITAIRNGVAGALDTLAEIATELALKATTASPTFTGEVTFPNTGLHLLDTNASHDLIVKPGSDLTADRTLTVTTGDTNVTVELTDAGADKVLFWDDSEAKWTALTLNAGLEISGTTIRAIETHGVALSDETSAITTGTNKATMSLPYAFTVTSVYATLNTASSSGTPTVDINEAGTTILSTKLTVDANEKTSATAAAAAVISDSAIAANAEIGFDIDVAGTGAKGLKVFIQGYRT